MRVKELRDALANADDNAFVVVEDLSDASINLVQVSNSKNIVYLQAIHYFPDEWYNEDGTEKGYDYDRERWEAELDD